MPWNDTQFPNLRLTRPRLRFRTKRYKTARRQISRRSLNKQGEAQRRFRGTRGQQGLTEAIGTKMRLISPRGAGQLKIPRSQTPPGLANYGFNGELIKPSKILHELANSPKATDRSSMHNEFQVLSYESAKIQYSTMGKQGSIRLTAMADSKSVIMASVVAIHTHKSRVDVSQHVHHEHVINTMKDGGVIYRMPLSAAFVRIVWVVASPPTWQVPLHT